MNSPNTVNPKSGSIMNAIPLETLQGAVMVLKGLGYHLP